MKIRKIISMLLVFFAITIFFSGCVDEEAEVKEEEKTSVVEKEEEIPTAEEKEKENPSETGNVDLTNMSKTMVYSKVYEIMVNPEDYVGKDIKLIGEFNTDYVEQTQRRYYTVFIADAAACCKQGFLMVWEGEHQYPDDYPAVGDTIEINGTFTSGVEEGRTYYYLVVHDMTIV